MKQLQRICQVRDKKCRIALLLKYFQTLKFKTLKASPEIVYATVDFYDLLRSIEHLRCEKFSVDLVNEYFHLFTLLDEVQSVCKAYTHLKTTHSNVIA